MGRYSDGMDAPRAGLEREKRRLEEEGRRLVAKLESPGYAPPGTRRRGAAFVLGALSLAAAVLSWATRPGWAGAICFVALGSIAWTLLRASWREVENPHATRLDEINARLRTLRAEVRGLESSPRSGS